MLVCYIWLLGISPVCLALPKSTVGDAGPAFTASTGTFTGIIKESAPHVRQFLRIPYGLPPVGDRRWAPPEKVTTNYSTQCDATVLPPSCPQYISRVPSVYNQVIPEWEINLGRQRPDAGAFAETSSEDCLYLAIWTPIASVFKLPVIFFMTGGAFETGGIDIPVQLPHHWVERTQSHIVVTINFRGNIMGFPNSAALKSQNLGLLDQRLALEWVRDNIEAFGGDPDRITMWGQSTGAVSTDYHNFAYPDDPIVRGFFMESGSVFLDRLSMDTARSNFSFVASRLGCGGLDVASELVCMRQVPVADIENFVGHYQDNTTLIVPNQAPIKFRPVVDEIIVYSNYTDRHAKGAYAKRPAIYSSCANEGVARVDFPTTPGGAPNQTEADMVTLESFFCAAVKSSMLRARQNQTTYRYQFAGNFTNVSPLYWMGAYHASDLPFLFGTHSDWRGESPPFEYDVSASMEDYVYAFMDDPVSGPQQLGWNPYSDNNVLRFGADGLVVQSLDVATLDSACSGSSYDSSP